MTASTMKAVRIHQYGGRDQLKSDVVPIPAPGAGDVLVKIHAAALNPVDCKVREGKLAGMNLHTLPLILGWDFAGEIVAKGEQVGDWAIGDEVFARPNIARDGSYAEYIVADANEIARKPKTASWQQAAALPLTSLTAWQVLFDKAQLKQGERVLIHAGAGGVGHIAIQLAKHAGAYVVSTCSTANVDFVRSLGADEVIDYTKRDFSALRDLDVVFDTLGAEVLAKSWQTLKKGGRLVSIIQTPDADSAARAEVDAQFWFVQPNAEQLSKIAKLFDDGKLRVELSQVLALDDIQRGHELLESGHTRGKIVLGF